jgi:PAS domain S-box-containing protein
LNDETRTREELIAEVEDLRRRVKGLEQTEEKYRNIYENATEGIFQIAADGHFISANPSLARIHGYESPEDLMGSVGDIGAQLYKDPSTRDELVRLLKERGRVRDFEVEMYRKDGSPHWIRINARAVRGPDGRTLFHEGTMQDITKRKEAEAALAESEERYRTAIEHSNDGVAIILGDRHVYVNRRFVEMFGYTSADEVVGKPLTLILHPDDRERVMAISRQRQQGGIVPPHYEFKGVRRDGESVHVEVSATGITYRNEPVVLVYLRDITKRKETEEALRVERERLRTLAEYAPFGIAMLNWDGRYLYVNPKFRELFGYDLSEVPNGKAWFQKAFPDEAYRREVITGWVGDVARSKSGQKMRKTFTVTCKDGTEKVVSFIPVRLESGEYLVSFEDVTEQKRAEEALLRSHKELEQLSRAKSKAINHVSHELKTPLAVIQGNARILQKKLRDLPGDGSIGNILESLERNVERLVRMQRETDEIFRASQEVEAGAVADDLDRLWGRIEALSDLPPETKEHLEALKSWLNKYLSGEAAAVQSIDLYPFVRLIVEKTTRLATQRRVQVQLDGVNDLYVLADPVILREVIEALLKNAIENTPDGGLIKVSVEEKGERISVAVTDFGVGITEENQPYVFGGLFHTKETDLYTSRRPYDFGAGGKGLDLLRIKMYGRKFGFELTMKSRRCVYIPTDQDLCPGDVAQCPHVNSLDECVASGGTTFEVSFPAGGAVSRWRYFTDEAEEAQ